MYKYTQPRIKTPKPLPETGILTNQLWNLSSLLDARILNANKKLINTKILVSLKYKNSHWMSVGIVQIPKNIVPLFYKHHELTKMNRYYLAINLLHELQISHSKHGLTMWKVIPLSHFIKSLSISLLHRNMNKVL